MHMGPVIGELGGGGDNVVGGIVLAQAAQVSLRKIFFDRFGIVFGKLLPGGQVEPLDFQGRDIEQAVMEPTDERRQKLPGKHPVGMNAVSGH